MKLNIPGEPHLTYCTNIHPGETWAEVRANVARYVPAVRARVAPGRPFGVGLRLSAEAAATLSREEAFEEFHAFLRAQQLYVHTINGFPYGRFHGRPVKERVYLPDWLDERRLDYTGRLASLLAELLPADQPALEGCISTVPGAYRARVRGEADVARIVEMLLRQAAVLHRAAERRGRVIVLALEPEPCCLLETVAETVRFFEDRLYARAALARFARLAGVGIGQSEAVLRRHLGVCVDVCHLAVEFEEAVPSIEALRAAEIRIGKIQLSAGLRVRAGNGAGRAPMPARPRTYPESSTRAGSSREAKPGGRGPAPEGSGSGHGAVGARGGNGGLAAFERLRELADPVYLHQVVERRDGTLHRYLDLPEALRALQYEPAGAREWRVHLHVPLFLRALGPFGNTWDQLEATLAFLRRRACTQHLEVETYTWDVLPAAYRRDDIVTSIARELNWVLARLVPVGASAGEPGP